MNTITVFPNDLPIELVRFLSSYPDFILRVGRSIDPELIAVHVTILTNIIDSTGKFRLTPQKLMIINKTEEDQSKIFTFYENLFIHGEPTLRNDYESTRDTKNN